MRATDEHIARFEQIFRDTRNKLYGFTSNLLRDEGLAEDCMQQCYLKLWEGFDKIDTERDVLPLLYTYARNLVIDHLRKRSREELIESLGPWEETMVDAGSTERYMTRREHEKQLEHAIKQMPPRRREVFQLVKLRGLSYRQASEELGISIHTVETHMHEAYRFLAARGSTALLIYCLMLRCI